jgi:fructose-bisphosphate aldolase class II
MCGIKSGFTSVMCDGSELSLQENIDRTKMVVKIARGVGVSVEGAIGEVVRPGRFSWECP